MVGGLICSNTVLPSDVASDAAASDAAADTLASRAVHHLGDHIMV